MKLLYIMKEIYIIFIIFILFILYNYFYVYEGLDQETISYTKSINELLSGNNWINSQIFDKDVTINGTLTGKDVKVTSNLSIKEVDTDLTVKNGKKICIGTTCIEEEHLKMLLGKQNIYLHTPNNGNDYLGRGNIGVESKWGSDDLNKKLQYGSWRMNSKPVNGAKDIIKPGCDRTDNSNYMNCLNTYNDTFL